MSWTIAVELRVRTLRDLRRDNTEDVGALARART